MKSCTSFHKAAMNAHASAGPAQQPVSQNATTVAAATEASHGALAPYINQIRALGAECQSIPGDEWYPKSCVNICNKGADLLAVQHQEVNEGAIQHGEHRLKQCKQSHKLAMDSN